LLAPKHPLFIFGFLTARMPGLTFGTQVVVLGINVFVGLNPQQPVASVTIIESFLGLTLGMVIAAVVGRLIWPSLALPGAITPISFHQTLKSICIA
jgi:hypothetical protein